MMIYNTNTRCNGTAFKRCSQATQVPASSPSLTPIPQGLYVPNGQVVPMGCENSLDILPHIIPDIHQCPDGTLISISTGRIIRDNTKTVKFPKMRTTIHTGGIRDWNSPSMDSGGLSERDIQYARMSEIENRKLRDSMTDEQKKMLSDLETGKIFRLSKLKNEK